MCSPALPWARSFGASVNMEVLLHISSEWLWAGCMFYHPDGFLLLWVIHSLGQHSHANVITYCFPYELYCIFSEILCSVSACHLGNSVEPGCNACCPSAAPEHLWCFYYYSQWRSSVSCCDCCVLLALVGWKCWHTAPQPVHMIETLCQDSMRSLATVCVYIC